MCLCAEWLFVNFLAENLPGINGVDALIGCTFFFVLPGRQLESNRGDNDRVGLITRVKLTLLFYMYELEKCGEL